MSLNAQNLDAFYCAAQNLSVTKAARQLHVTQSALSQRIKNLEHELQVPLFIRSAQGLRLTEAGERLVAYCRAKEAAEDELRGELHSGANTVGGTIRVGAFSTVGRSHVLPALTPLVACYPEICLHLLIREVYELSSLLRSGEVDCVIATHSLGLTGVVEKEVGSEEYVLVQRNGYEGPEVYLDHDPYDTITATYLGLSCDQLRRHYLDDIFGIIDGVRAGMGRAVVPVHLIQELSEIEIINPDRRLRVPLILHWRDHALAPQLHGEVVRALEERLIALRASI